MKYLLIDTNVYIQCCLLELEGDDHEVLKKLESLLNQDKLILLLPEVVELELDKALEDKFAEIKNQIGIYKEAINKDAKLDSRVKKDLIAKLTQCSEEREKNTREVKYTVKKIFQHKNTKKIKISAMAMENAYRMFLADKKPYSREEGGQIQPDCLIIEAAKEFLQSEIEYEFMLCSSNKRDFADNPNEKDKKIIVAKDINSSFKNISYYVTLYQCLNDNFQTVYPKEVIEKASSKFYQPVKQYQYSSLSSLPSVNFNESSILQSPGAVTLPLHGIKSNNISIYDPVSTTPITLGVASYTQPVTVQGSLTIGGDKQCQKCGMYYTPSGLEQYLSFSAYNYCDNCKRTI